MLEAGGERSEEKEMVEVWRDGVMGSREALGVVGSFRFEFREFKIRFDCGEVVNFEMRMQ